MRSMRVSKQAGRSARLSEENMLLSSSLLMKPELSLSMERKAACSDENLSSTRFRID